MDRIVQDNSIKIIFDNDNKIELNSNNPDLNNFVSKVVELKDTCNFENLEVETDNPDFDKEGFKSIVITSIKSFLKDIEINEEELNKALNCINNVKDKN